MKGRYKSLASTFRLIAFNSELARLVLFKNENVRRFCAKRKFEGFGILPANIVVIELDSLKARRLKRLPFVRAKHCNSFRHWKKMQWILLHNRQKPNRRLGGCISVLHQRSATAGLLSSDTLIVCGWCEVFQFNPYRESFESAMRWDRKDESRRVILLWDCTFRCRSKEVNI